MKLSNFKIMSFFIKPYPRYIGAIAFLILVYAVLEGLSLGVLFSVFESTMAVPQAASGGKFTVYFDKLIGLMPTADKLIGGCLLLILVVGLKDITGYLSQVLGSITGYKIWKDNQLKIFKKYIESDYQQFLDAKQGEVLYRIYTAPGYLGFLLNSIPQIATELIKILVLAVILFSLAFKMSLAVISFCVLYYFLTRFIARSISYNLGRGRIEAGEEQNVLIAEMFIGIRQIKLFGSESRWVNKFFTAMKKYFSLAGKDSIWLAVPKHSLDFVFMAGFGVILIVVKLTNPEGLYTMLPVLGAFAYSFLRIMPSLNQLSTNWMQLMGVLPNLETLYSILTSNTQKIQDGQKEVTNFKESIRFDNVTFFYPGREHVLRDFTVEFKKGRQTAIVGPSGAGKTTIVDLIIRLFDPTQGKILVDGVDLKELKIQSWLKKIGYVSQDTFIFNATLAENIAFGFEASREDIIQAAREANAHEFIMQFPQAYDTVVGDRGMKLSGGQRQRIAIARALIRKPEILILDEATSSLDTVSEAIVQEAINNATKNHTVIMIAHRLSTVKNAGKIFVLDQGKIVESGTHEELLVLNGKYRQYHAAQSNPAGVAVSS